MIEIAVLRAMAAAGAGVEAIIAAVEADQKQEAEKRACKREGNRKRQIRHRNARNALSALQNENIKENNDRVTLVTPPPPNPLIKNLPSEEESKILEFASARPEEKKEGFGYSSSDGSVSFTAAEITKIGLDFYSLTNVYGQIRSLAESGWVEKMRPPDRKRAIFYKLRKLHNERVRNFAPDKIEQQVQAKQAAEAQQDDQERALAVRQRLYGGRSAG